MCGLAGIINLNNEKVKSVILADMQESIKHRGPDHQGSYIENNIGLAHNRLAVIDPSPDANQPFISEDSRYIMVYNGTLYNFRELKSELLKAGYRFRTECDTEVVLYSYMEWKEKCLNKFNGVFAFAVLDKKSNNLFAARDRYGARPFYYYMKSNLFLFGSELKVFSKHPDFKKEVDIHALKEYFSFQNIFSDRTILKNVKLLPQGHFMILDIERGEFKVKKYWDFDFSEKTDIEYQEAVNELRNLLHRAITRQLVSDVPLGSYLSGGVDSSILVGIASRSLPMMPTFTGGFYMEGVEGREAEFDEREKAEFTANYFNLPNYQVIMNSHTMPNILGDLVYHNDDLRVGQCWQNYTVAHLASRFVKVVLCGAGGDELFGGYPWRYKIAGSAASEKEFNDNYFSYWQRMVPEKKMEDFFVGEVYSQINEYRLRDVYDAVFEDNGNSFESFYDRIFYFELKTFLQGLLLVEDKLSMAHGLETRVPLLDNEIVDFALKIPVQYKISEGIYGGKKILMDAEKDLLPEQLFKKKKQGFSPPDENWYRTETYSFIKDTLLEDDNLNNFIQKDYIEKVLLKHKEGENKRLLLWSLLNFKLWLKRYLY